MPVYRMVISYDGASFHGFARQPGVPTVQQRLEEGLSKILGGELPLSVAGRTDAGVHALGQVVSFTREEAIEDAEALIRSLNALCGPDIAVFEIAQAPEGFDARFSASSRTYEYAIFTREVPDPFSRHTTWHVPQNLDLDAMSKAAQALLGEHDFSSFGRVAEGQSPVRRIEEINIEETENLILIRITANSFIQQMVRSIVGTLVKVGSGKIDPGSMDEILHARDRSAAGAVAPPQGLFLVSVSYPEDLV